MTTFFADRGFVTINGTELGNIKSLKYTIDESITRVDTMTRNKRSAGWKQGNRKVTGSFELEIPDLQAQIDLAFQYGNDISITCQVGTKSERHTLVGVVQSNQDLNGSVGETGKAINFEATDAINENGSAVNASIGF